MKKIINNLKYVYKKYSFLLEQLVSRDFKVKYKRSVLGVVWSLLYPLLMMAVMAIVFSNVFKNVYSWSKLPCIFTYWSYLL